LAARAVTTRVPTLSGQVTRQRAIGAVAAHAWVVAARCDGRTTMWLVSLLAPLFLIGIVALALGGTEPPARIQTFSRSSDAEKDFDRRSGRLQMVGLSIMSLAILVSLLLGLHWLG
jgi:hypothetical protein